MKNIDTTKYLEAHNKVIGVMDCIRGPVLDEIASRIDDGEEWTQDMRDRALDYARIYALRDVMALMEYGFSLDDALARWKEGIGFLGMDGECMNAVVEAWEDFNDDEDWEED